MSRLGRFISDEGHAPATQAPSLFMGMLFAAAVLVVIAVVVGSMVPA